MEYLRLMLFIEQTVDHPPPYSLVFGSQCATWAISAIVAAAAEGSSPLLPNLRPDSFVGDLLESVMWNPWTIESIVNVNKKYLEGAASRPPVNQDPPPSTSMATVSRRSASMGPPSCLTTTPTVSRRVLVGSRLTMRGWCSIVTATG